MRLAGFAAALGFLTRLPTMRASQGAVAADLADAAPWLPTVGLLVGLVVALAAALGSLLAPTVGALLGLVAWVVVTGALHLDGLGDSADAAGAAHGDPARYVAVLKDPNAGNFAITAIALQIAAKFVLLSVLVDHGFVGLAAIVLVAAWARCGVLVWSSALAPLTDGLAARLRRGVTRNALTANGVLLMLVSLVLAPALLLAPLVLWLGVVLWRRGPVAINGDGLGALIEVGESALLLLAAVGLALGLRWL